LQAFKELECSLPFSQKSVFELYPERLQPSSNIYFDILASTARSRLIQIQQSLAIRGHILKEELDDLVTRSSENRNDPEDEVLDVVRPEFSNKSLNEIFTLSRQLSDKVFELDPNMESSIKFKRELDRLLAFYKEIRKELKKKE
jgi:hypothetical protein